MSLDAPQSNKMMTGAPEKKGYHFAGNGLWHAQYILADSIEEAEKIWHEKKQLLRPEAPIVPVEQGATPEPAIEPEKAEEAEEIIKPSE